MCLPPVGSAPYLFFVHYLNTLAKFTTQLTRPKPNKLANKTNISENSTNPQRPSPSPRRPCAHLTQLKKHAQFACIPGFTDYYQVRSNEVFCQIVINSPQYLKSKFYSKNVTFPKTVKNVKVLLKWVLCPFRCKFS